MKQVSAEHRQRISEALIKNYSDKERKRVWWQRYQQTVRANEQARLQDLQMVTLQRIEATLDKILVMLRRNQPKKRWWCHFGI